MTPQQGRCLEIVRALSQDGVPPTYAAIGERMGLAKSTVYRTIHALAEAGLLEATPGRYRTLRVRDALRTEIQRLVEQHGAERVRAEITEVTRWRNSRR